MKAGQRRYDFVKRECQEVCDFVKRECQEVCDFVKGGSERGYVRLGRRNRRIVTMTNSTTTFTEFHT